MSERGVGQSVFTIGEKAAPPAGGGRSERQWGSSVRFSGGRAPGRLQERRTYFPLPKMMEWVLYTQKYLNYKNRLTTPRLMWMTNFKCVFKIKLLKKKIGLYRSAFLPGSPKRLCAWAEGEYFGLWRAETPKEICKFTQQAGDFSVSLIRLWSLLFILQLLSRLFFKVWQHQE